MNTDPTFWFSLLAILMSIVMSSLTVYNLLRFDTLSREMKHRTNENKARIGRLIRELNIIHDQKRAIDNEQTRKIRNTRDTMDEIVQDHKTMKGGEPVHETQVEDGEQSYEYFERV